MEDAKTEGSRGPATLPTSDPTTSGRIGPPDVILDILSNVGTLIMEPDRLGVCGREGSTLEMLCQIFMNMEHV